MTNYDKIKNMSMEEMYSFLVDIKQGNFEHVYIREWLGDKTKPILSVVERMILENIDKDYKWIARDKDTKLFIYRDKPSKSTLFYEWLVDGKSENISTFRRLFQFITWQDDEPYNIEELLKN